MTNLVVKQLRFVAANGQNIFSLRLQAHVYERWLLFDVLPRDVLCISCGSLRNQSNVPIDIRFLLVVEI